MWPSRQASASAAEPLCYATRMFLPRRVLLGCRSARCPLAALGPGPSRAPAHHAAHQRFPLPARAGRRPRADLRLRRAAGLLRRQPAPGRARSARSSGRPRRLGARSCCSMAATSSRAACSTPNTAAWPSWPCSTRWAPRRWRSATTSSTAARPRWAATPRRRISAARRQHRRRCRARACRPAAAAHDARARRLAHRPDRADDARDADLVVAGSQRALSRAGPRPRAAPSASCATPGRNLSSCCRIWAWFSTRALAEAGPDVIIGGHSHTLLSNSEPGAFSRYPSPAPDAALVVQARRLWPLSRPARPRRRVPMARCSPGAATACMSASIPPEDPEVAAIVAGFAAPLDAFRHETIAVLPEALDVAGCRLGPCQLGQAIAARDPCGDAGGAGRDHECRRHCGSACPPAGHPWPGARGAAVRQHGRDAAARPAPTSSPPCSMGSARSAAAASRNGRGFAWPAPSCEVQGTGEDWAPIDPEARYEVGDQQLHAHRRRRLHRVARPRASTPTMPGPGSTTIVSEALASGALSR